jgi:hypothetical protein
VIVALHVATGAAAGAASGSRLAALLLGPVLHLVGDRLPHQDIRSRGFEIGSGLAGLLLLAARRGPLDPSTLGAAASSAPDLEHVLPFLGPGGRKLFHGRGWHRSGRFPADLQLLQAVAILGALTAPRGRAGRERAPEVWHRQRAPCFTLPHTTHELGLAGERIVPPRAPLGLGLRAENLHGEDTVGGDVRTASRPPADGLPLHDHGPAVGRDQLTIVGVFAPARAAGDRPLA